jgi:hypothetical protein
MFVAMGAIFTFHAPHGAYYHSAAAWLPFAFPMAVAAAGPALTSMGRAWAFLRRPQTHRFVEIAALVGAIVLSLIGSASLYHLWESSHQRDVAAAEYLQEAGLTDDVVLYGDPASLWHLSANPGVAAPFDPYPVVEEVVRAYDVRWVIVTLREDADIDPLGLWNGCEAIDSQGNQATWLECDPAFETDGVRIFAVRAPGDR